MKMDFVKRFNVRNWQEFGQIMQRISRIVSYDWWCLELLQRMRYEELNWDHCCIVVAAAWGCLGKKNTFIS